MLGDALRGRTVRVMSAEIGLRPLNVCMPTSAARLQDWPENQAQLKSKLSSAQHQQITHLSQICLQDAADALPESSLCGKLLRLPDLPCTLTTSCCAGITDVVLDKTGTLTAGRLRMVDAQPFR